MTNFSVGLLGQKLGMTQLFDAKGKLIPITIVKGGPCFITQLKFSETHGYNAIQVGYLEVNQKKKKKLTKAEFGHCSTVSLPPLRHLKEYRVNTAKEVGAYKIGDTLDVNFFEKTQLVSISGLSLGKGNLGNIKRHKFNRGAMTHGSKHHRLQGSMGSGTTPGRVFPGKRMPGKEGKKNVTLKNLELFSLDTEKNLLLVKGSLPGKFGNLLSIKRV